jgi:hypothetical protein
MLGPALRTYFDAVAAYMATNPGVKISVRPRATRA